MEIAVKMESIKSPAGTDETLLIGKLLKLQPNFVLEVNRRLKPNLQVVSRWSVETLGLTKRGKSTRS